MAEDALALVQRAAASVGQERASAPVSAAAVVGSSLERGQRLGGGDALVSPSGRFSLVMTPEGIVELREAPNRLNPEPYVTRLMFGAPDSQLVMQEDGNVVLYADGVAQDDTETAGSSGRSLRVQDDGNVVLYGDGSRVVFSFDTHARDVLAAGGTLLPGERLRWIDGATELVMQEDGNLVLYTRGVPRFASGTRTPGAGAVLQEDGNFVVYGPDGRALWDSGTVGPWEVALAVGDREFRLVAVEFEDAEVVFGSEWGSSTVEPGHTLLPGDRRTAPGGIQLVMQNDGNLVQYVRGRPAFSIGPSRSTARIAIMQPDGNFVVYQTGEGNNAAELTPVFQTRTASNPGSRLVVQADANVVVYDPINRPLFATRR